MEAVGTVSEGEWNSSFNGMCSEEADFMARLLGNCLLPNEVHGSNVAVSSSFWPSNGSNVNILGADGGSMYSSDEMNAAMFSFSLGSSYGGGGNSIVLPYSSHEFYYPFVNNSNNSMAADCCTVGGKNSSSRLTNNVMEGDDFLSQDVSSDSIESGEKLPEDVLRGKNLQPGIEKETPTPEPLEEDKISSPPEMSMKRPRVPGEFQRCKKLKKCAKIGDNDENNNSNKTNVMLHRQGSSGCCSEDDSNASHEVNGVASSSTSKGSGALNSNGKTRASRGSATDPQSLYARKRRERINERLRILQNLVPNGTKVDISTMLEEAVQYVKFLQLQIKLLSSDELWMYAPIAYNGMDIGLDFKIPTPKPES